MAKLKQAAVSTLTGGKLIADTRLVNNLVVMYLCSVGRVVDVEDLRDLFVAEGGDLRGFADPNTGSSPIQGRDSDELEEIIARDSELAPYFAEKITFRFSAQAKKAGGAAKDTVVNTFKKYW